MKSARLIASRLPNLIGKLTNMKHITGFFVRNVTDNNVEITALNIALRLSVLT